MDARRVCLALSCLEGVIGGKCNSEFYKTRQKIITGLKTLSYQPCFLFVRRSKLLGIKAGVTNTPNLICRG